MEVVVWESRLANGLTAVTMVSIDPEIGMWDAKRTLVEAIHFAGSACIARTSRS